MTDVIHLDNISSGDCGCNKPKKSCGCSSSQPCALSMPGGDTYFKVKNLFGELRSEWQRAEARSNLGVTDIIRLDLIQYGENSGDSNIWQMVTTKGGDQRVFDFVVKNGKAGRDGKDATIEVFRTETLEPESAAIVRNITNDDSNVKLYFGIPRGNTGPQGLQGKSAFELATENGFNGTILDWLNSLKGETGDLGDQIEQIQLSDYGQFRKTLPNGTQILKNMYIWNIILSSGRAFEFWVPDGGTYTEPTETSTTKPIFLYKLVQFSSIPSAVNISSKLAELLNEVNNGNVGKLPSELQSQYYNWWPSPQIIANPGKDYIFMAVTTGNDTAVDKWSVIQLTGMVGPSGSTGASGQSLVGPVIRMRGGWSNEYCYKNQSTSAQEGNYLRFIDIVEWSGNYWMVNPGIECANKNITPDLNPSLWTQADPYDFSFINVLISNYIQTNSIDADEVRIHDRSDNGDIIVAGMTGGHSINASESIIDNNDGEDDPIRIWAGTSANIKNKGLYTLDLTNAKFRVHLSGKLFAEDAEVTGIVEALTLRLKALKTGEGTFIQPTNTSDITLPNLPGDKIQMFYILTNSVAGNITVHANSGDTILGQYAYTVKPSKLYLLFGINSTWYVVELDLHSASTIINNDGGILTLGEDYAVSGQLEIETSEFNNSIWEPEVDLKFTVTNYTDTGIIVSLPATMVVVYVSYEDTQGSIRIGTPIINIPVEARATKVLQLHWIGGVMSTGTPYPLDVQVDLSVSTQNNNPVNLLDETDFVNVPYYKEDDFTYGIMPGYFTAKLATEANTNISSTQFADYADIFNQKFSIVPEINQPNN